MQQQAKQILELRKQKEEEMKQEDMQKKQESRLMQQKYADTLRFQSEIAKKLKSNFGQMTFQEKKFNHEDLYEYKHGGNFIHSLVPGINNIPSVGASPMAKQAYEYVKQGGNHQLPSAYETLNGQSSGRQSPNSQMGKSMIRNASMPQFN